MTYTCKENIFTCVCRFILNDRVHTARFREDETQDGHRNSKCNPELSNSGFFPFEISRLMMMSAWTTFKSGLVPLVRVCAVESAVVW